MALLTGVLATVAGAARSVGDAADEPRIVSLAPHLTELAYSAGIGDRLVGAVAWSDHPSEAGELPRIGDAFRFDLERIARLEATHALAWPGGTPADAISRLESLGIRVESVAIRTLEDVPRALLELGRLGRAPEPARRAARAFNRRLGRLTEKYATESPPTSVFYQVSRSPLFTLGRRHVINDVLALCGAENVFADLDTEAAAIGLESVLERDPDAILIGRADGQAPDRPLWDEHPSLRAVRCGRVLEVQPDRLVRPTTRLLDGAEMLCEWLDRRVRRAEDPACRTVGG